MLTDIPADLFANLLTGFYGVRDNRFYNAYSELNR